MADASSPLTSDRDLLLAWRAGDAAAGDDLVQRHFPAVYRFFRSKLVADVDDLAQQTLEACLSDSREPVWTTSFRAYLLGVARHLLFRRFRKDDRERRALDRAAITSEKLSGTPTSALIAKDELGLLAAALRKIPIDLQIAVELYYWESMSVAEIAAVVEIPPGTVQSRLARARKLLGEQIESAAVAPELRRATLDGFERWARELRGRLDR